MNLYKLTNGFGNWYVVETDPTAAKLALEHRLTKEDYGFFKDREVCNIEVVAKMVKPALNSKWFFSNGCRLIIPVLEESSE